MQPIKIEVAPELAVAEGPFPIDFLKVANGLLRKRWVGNQLHFPPSPVNMGLVKRSGWPIEWSGPVIEAERAAEEARRIEAEKVLAFAAEGYVFPHPPLDYQKPILAKMLNTTSFALLLEMGLGKTALLVWNAGILHKLGKVNGVAIVAPNGVHRQWVEDQVKEHLDPSIEYEVIVWKPEMRSKPPVFRKKDGVLTFFAINMDSACASNANKGRFRKVGNKGRTGSGFAALHNFLEVFKYCSFFILDESHMIKNPGTARAVSMLKIAKFATYRRIATGTPISKHIGDAWSQFTFLDPAILGKESFVAFREEFCVMAGYDNKQIVDSKNLEEFYALIHPHSARLTKKEAGGLPEKIYVRREYVMSEKTAKHYEELKRQLLTEMSDGTIVDARNAQTGLLRLQQVLSGYLPLEAGDYEVFSDERLDEMMEIIAQVEGQVNIWARFQMDIQRVKQRIDEEFGAGSCVTYYGLDGKPEREENLKEFFRGEKRFIVSNPAAGGVGRNEFRFSPNTIYFSNSFDALQRWQSEDRTHRHGMNAEIAPTYFDLEARRRGGAMTVDRVILRNLSAKKSLSDLTFDEIRAAVAEA